MLALLAGATFIREVAQAGVGPQRSLGVSYSASSTSPHPSANTSLSAGGAADLRLQPGFLHHICEIAVKSSQVMCIYMGTYQLFPTRVLAGGVRLAP